MSFIVNYTQVSGVPHKHNNYEIIICTGGKSLFWCEAFEREISSGEIIVIPPATSHRIIVGPHANRIFISGEFQQFFNLNSVNIIHDNEKGDGVYLAKMIYDNRHANSEYVCALINAFTHFLLCNIKIDNKIHLSVKKIIDKISNDFGNSELYLPQILAETKYSEDYIREQFKHITGKTPTEFLTTVRITHACYLIDTYRHSVPLTIIAEQCGYTDYVYFSKKFKQITGVSPRKYTEITVLNPDKM